MHRLYFWIYANKFIMYPKPSMNNFELLFVQFIKCILMFGLLKWLHSKLTRLIMLAMFYRSNELLDL